jgi:dipeptidyl aminopeptidase/acylaminoacyl peptidase
MRPLNRIVALCLLLAASPALARPFTLDDLLGVEAFGGAYISPGGRWLVIQRIAPYDSARRYDDDVFEPMALGRLDIADLRQPGPARPLLDGADGEGVNAGPFSPDGRRMVVFRLERRNWDLGLADLEHRTVRWLGLAVEPANWGRTVQWRSNNDLVAIAMADDARAGRLGPVWAAEDRPAARWAVATEGKVPTDTVVGSGRFRGLTPDGPPTHLVRVDASSGRSQILASGAFLDLEISSSGRFVAALREAAAIQPRADEVVRTGSAARRRTLELVDLATGAVTQPCGGLDLATHLLSWAPHRDQLLVYARSGGEDWSLGALTRIDAARGRCGPVATPGLHPSVLYGLEGFPMVRADWLGDDPIVLAEPAQPKAPERRDWRRLSAQGAINLTSKLPAPPSTLAAIDDRGLLAIDGGGAWRVDRLGRSRRLSGPFNQAVLAGDAGTGDRLAYTAVRRPDIWLSDGHRVALADRRGLGRVQALAPGALPAAAAAGILVVRFVDTYGVSTLTVQASGRSRPVAHFNATYADITFADLVAVPYLGPKGEALTGWLYRPPHLPAGREPPLIVVPYPGSVYPTPPKAYAPGSSFLEISPQLLATAGYAVLIPSLPRDWSSHEPAAGLADAIVLAADAVAKTGLADTDRMVLWGHSYGGYAALAAATQTNRFKAVIEASGKSDLISAYGPFTPPARSAPEDGLSINATTGWMENGQGDLGVSPAQDIARYARNSPALHADRIACPVLLIHGDLDFVPLAQGEEMFSALYRQNKDAVLVTLWGEGHTATSPANVRRMYAWIFWWLGQTVGPGVTS